MAGFRKLPSGKWQASLRGPDGKRHTKTDPLKSVVRAWANEQETKIAQGLWRDPRAGNIPVAEWAGKWFAARVVEPETRRGDEGVLGKHILPHWGTWRLNAIGPLDVQAWVRTMQQDRVGPSAIRRAFNLFAVMMADAVTAEVLGQSPCRKITRPAVVPKLPAWFTRTQVDRIRAALLPRYPGHAAMVELMVCVGLRWGEAAAVCGDTGGPGNPVDWLRGRISVVGALNQFGKWRELPKTSKSRREVPVPRHVLAELAALLKGRTVVENCPCGLAKDHRHVFITPRSRGPLSGSNWRKIWYEAIDAANIAGAKARPKLEPIPKYDPHDCRHTAASWLVQAGVPLYDVQALLGHEHSQTTQRYAHLQPDAHGSVERAWRTILAHQRRTDPEKGEASGS